MDNGGMSDYDNRMMDMDHARDNRDELNRVNEQLQTTQRALARLYKLHRKMDKQWSESSDDHDGRFYNTPVIKWVEELL